MSDEQLKALQKEAGECQDILSKMRQYEPMALLTIAQALLEIARRMPNPDIERSRREYFGPG